MVIQVGGILGSFQAKMPRAQSCPTFESNSGSDLDDLRERLGCLLRQEQKHYLCENYIQAEDAPVTARPETCAVEQCARVVSDLAFSPPDEALQTFPSSVCVKDLVDSQVRSSFVREQKTAASSKLVGYWRQQMLDWSYLVVLSFGIDREVVASSFNILDRYVAREMTSHLPISREDFQLFSMTALFIGVKLLGTFPRKLTADGLVDMSRGFYAAEDILHTEQEILKTLGFFLNPTTAIGFCRIYWEMFPVPVSFEFQELCSRLAESALGDSYFMTKKPSVVGLAAVLIAARAGGHKVGVTDRFLSRVKDTLGIPCMSDFDAMYRRLELLSYQVLQNANLN